VALAACADGAPTERANAPEIGASADERDTQLVRFLPPGAEWEQRSPDGPETAEEVDVRRKAKADAVQRRSREQAAAAALARIAQAQQQAQSARLVDTDRDGVGEPLLLGELLGLAAVRGRTDAYQDAASLRLGIAPAMVARRAVGNGYVFQVFVRGPGGTWLTDAELGGVDAAAPASSLEWRAYAWPLEHRTSGTLAFFVDQRGCVMAAANDRTGYHGHERTPDPGAADAVPAEGVHETDAHRGNDGDWWRPWRLAPAD
jgi:hypothetical protein